MECKKITLMNKSDPVLHYRKSQHEVDETYDFSFVDKFVCEGTFVKVEKEQDHVNKRKEPFRRFTLETGILFTVF